MSEHEDGRRLDGIEKLARGVLDVTILAPGLHGGSPTGWLVTARHEFPPYDIPTIEGEGATVREALDDALSKIGEST